MVTVVQGQWTILEDRWDVCVDSEEQPKTQRWPCRRELCKKKTLALGSASRKRGMERIDLGRFQDLGGYLKIDEFVHGMDKDTQYKLSLTTTRDTACGGRENTWSDKKGLGSYAMLILKMLPKKLYFSRLQHNCRSKTLPITTMDTIGNNWE